MNKIKIEKYWYRYLKTLPDETNLYPVYGVMQFGDTAELANKLGELVLNGMKTATCATLWEWDAEQANPYKEIGANTMVLNGDGVPLCIIETTEILIRPFNEVLDSCVFTLFRENNQEWLR